MIFKLEIITFCSIDNITCLIFTDLPLSALYTLKAKLVW